VTLDLAGRSVDPGRAERRDVLLATARTPFVSPLLRVTPWLQLVGALATFVLIALHSAIHSELGRPLTTGESPGFSHARASINALMWLGLAYLLLVAALQQLGARRSGQPHARALAVLAGVELAAIGLVATGLAGWWEVVLPWGHALLQASLLVQALATVVGAGTLERVHGVDLLDLAEGRHAPFLSCLFLAAAARAALDPSTRSLHAYFDPDSTAELVLSYLLPPVLSGVTGLWFGAATLALLTGLRAVWMRVPLHSTWRPLIGFLPFLALSGLYTGIFMSSAFYAIEWELERLRLEGAVPAFLVLVSGGGAALGSVAYRRLARRMPQGRKPSLIGMLSLSMGALLAAPLSWVLTRSAGAADGAGSRARWRLVLGTSLAAVLGFGYVVVAGDLFNPWFTVFSYLKGALLKAAAVVVAGIAVLVLEELQPRPAARPPTAGGWLAVAAACLLGFVPFAALERAREVKTALLQFSELGMVDATYARAVADVLALGRWVRVGQAPSPGPAAEPWPLPWTLARAGAPRTPADFNLVIVVVDALRGDAFGSAGYSRNLTPFLDAWGAEEAVSFRRAYSQGGGTFSALPFLVGGRSAFSYYGPDLYRRNVYFELARAEGIRHVMIVRDWPRAIFPPELPIIRLGASTPSLHQRSDSAGEVFGWAQAAIEALPAGERFFALLVLLDVHNDLCKKAEGEDFGDGPRDLYDNNLSYVDLAFRRFVTWLRQRGLYDRTIVLFTSDHGEQFWEHGASLHGHTLYEEEIRIPLMLRVPGLAGRIEDVPALASDMVPTIAELAGYAVHPPYDDPRMGISLVPLLLREERDRYLRRDVVGMASFKRRYFLYRNWEWKLVYSADFDLLELFHPPTDPGERENLLQERPDLAAALERELLGYLARVAGRAYRPLLREPIPTVDAHAGR
jgi:Sulfatase